MDIDEMVKKSKHRSQSERGAVQSQFALLYHPLLMPNNYWVWRFVPGVIVGVILGKLFTPKFRKKESNDLDQEEVLLFNQDEELKLVMVVNKGLKTMKAGKIAAQCGHASAMVVKKLLTEGKGKLFKAWEGMGQRKVVLKAPSREEMEALGDAASAAGLMVTTVLDAGRTQVEAGSMTVMAIGPGENTKIDSITGHLALM